MKIEFENEDGAIVFETKKNIPLPQKDDLIHLKSQFYRVRYTYFDYDNNTITVDIETE